MASKTIIEINGRKYDARTGEIITDAPTKTSVVHHVTAQPTGVIDGFQRPKAKLRSSITPKVATKKPQKSQTLARNVVTKPSPAVAQRANAPVAPAPKAVSVAEARRRTFAKTPPARVERAQSTPLSHKVTKFSHGSPTNNPVVTAHLPVKKESSQAHSSAPAAAPPVAKHAPNTHPTKKQVFTHPLAGANAHLALPPKKRKFHQKAADTLRVSTKTMSLAAGCMAIVILGSFFAYQRIPNIGMRVAASKAGFSGTLPANTPAGYSFKGPVNYSKDVITVNYQSNSDDRRFNIVQRPSTWSSEGLLANYVQASKLKYQTYNDRGLTVYIMGNNNASWVNKGIWYTVSGTNTLSTEQILAMAASM